MPRSAKTAKSPVAVKTGRPVTLKHFAAALAEEHQLTKRVGEAILGDLVGTITKHLKKGHRIRMKNLPTGPIWHLVHVCGTPFSKRYRFVASKPRQPKAT
jgi:hypothetical protein